jgi:hypothetical protein
MIRWQNCQQLNLADHRGGMRGKERPTARKMAIAALIGERVSSLSPVRAC